MDSFAPSSGEWGREEGGWNRNQYQAEGTVSSSVQQARCMGWLAPRRVEWRLRSACLAALRWQYGDWVLILMARCVLGHGIRQNLTLADVYI